MNRTAALLLLVTAGTAGLAAGFFRPAEPHQVPAEARPVFERSTNKNSQAFVDAGLDNDAIEEDANIHPARKCGFCMG